MRVALFCGGQGMRIREYSERIPKPLVPLGSRPIMWHLMKYYAHHGHKDFILCLGYKGDQIKEYFLDYKEWLSNDFVLESGEVDLLNSDIEDWRITFVDTGLDASIGERLWAVREHLADEEAFLANYADGLTDLFLPDLLDDFKRRDKVATFLCGRPTHQTFDLVELDEHANVKKVQDAAAAGVRVNAGYFAFRSSVFDYLEDGDDIVTDLFEKLIAANQLTAYAYDGFWAGIDTWKDRLRLDSMMHHGTADWQVWHDEP